MIISCPSCKKKFEIDSTLISAKGRELQCGLCNYIWFYKVEKKISTPVTLEKDHVSEEDQASIISDKNNSKNIVNKSDLNKDLHIDLSKHNEFSISKFLSYIIVFLISFVALIIVLDTFKIPLIDSFPDLEGILYNLFETLKDIFLFAEDLL